jgi:tetratricopeptide (TPR) repeat protein
VEKSLAANRLKRYVGGLAALTALPAVALEAPASLRHELRESPRLESESLSGTAGLTSSRSLAAVVDLIQREDWARAQRLLEEVIRQEPDDELSVYLGEVRAVRRTLRQLRRRPRDATLHLELGRLYFGLELGEQAEAEFKRVVTLESTLPEGHFCLALEYLFRDDEFSSRQSHARAVELRPDLPTFESLRRALYESTEQ